MTVDSILIAVGVSVALISNCSANSNVSETMEVTPYDPPFSCAGEYQCPGESVFRGKVSSNQYFWTVEKCRNDLLTQVQNACDGNPAKIGNFEYQNRREPPTFGKGADCQKFDPHYDYFITMALNDRGRSGWAGAIDADQRSSIRRAVGKCERAGKCSQWLVSRNGCVGFFEDTHSRKYLFSACTRETVRNTSGNRRLREVKIYCARDIQ